MSEACLQQALAYQRRGWSVVPCGADRRPLTAWKRYQAQRASESQIRAWWVRWPTANVAIITGSVSGIIVLDLDHGHKDGADGLTSVRAAGLDLPSTRCVRTPRGGLHCYYRHPGGGKIPNAAGLLPGVDLRGDGGYVLAPPSGTPTLGVYTAVAATRRQPYAQAPDWVVRRSRGRGGKASPARPGGKWTELWALPCPEGQRNATCARLAGHLAGHGLPEEEATALLDVWATTRCFPPMDLREVATTVESIYRSCARHADPLPEPAPMEEARAAWHEQPKWLQARLRKERQWTGGALIVALNAGATPAVAFRWALELAGDTAQAESALRWALRRAHKGEKAHGVCPRVQCGSVASASGRDVHPV